MQTVRTSGHHGGVGVAEDDGQHHLDAAVGSCEKWPTPAQSAAGEQPLRDHSRQRGDHRGRDRRATSGLRLVNRGHHFLLLAMNHSDPYREDDSMPSHGAISTEHVCE